MHQEETYEIEDTKEEREEIVLQAIETFSQPGLANTTDTWTNQSNGITP
jgi:hypothetical protein